MESKPNAIFRNQPNYTYFNKSFGDPKDPAFHSLNEIDPFFLQPEQQADKRGFETFILKDPRNQQRIKHYIYDHTQEVAPKLFHSPKWSCLLKAEHRMGVAIVKARQDASETTEDDYRNWKKIEGRHVKESQEFQNFVLEFNRTNKEQIFASARILGDQYKKWYARKAEILHNKYPAETYNTHLGLPHVRVCKEVLKEQWADIVEVDIVAEKGKRAGRATKERLEFRRFQRSLDIYIDDYLNAEDMEEALEEELKSEFLKTMEQQDIGDVANYYIPLESLLLLLTAGDYCDIPMEMLIEIKEREAAENEEKYITMDKPLPSRHMGWHTNNQVLEQATLAMLSLPTKEEDENVPEIKSYPSTELLDFPVKPFEDFMNSCSMTPSKKCTFLQILTKWQLKASGKEAIKHIYTTLNGPPYLQEHFSLKLEYKSSFGCELMTKYELLNEWFKLKLQKTTAATCYRLDINDYSIFLQETQNLQKLELQLKVIYNISMPQLLSNLYEFLTLLMSMPSGNYMLRYNPKFKDKIMLCTASQEVTQNTIHLHQLLATEPSELQFMAEPNYLPIASDLCSRLHETHQILPCTFRPALYLKKPGKNPKEQKTFKPLNDREFILKKIQNEKDKQNKFKSPLIRAYNKKNQRARRTQRRAKEKANAEQEKEELQRDMDIDQFILGV